jgi:hypothetical protein
MAVPKVKALTLGDDIRASGSGRKEYERVCLRCEKEFTTDNRYQRLCGMNCQKAVAAADWL